VRCTKCGQIKVRDDYCAFCDEGVPPAPEHVIEPLHVPPERPKHGLYIVCDGVPLDLS
jgi:hypothetical protein